MKRLWKICVAGLALLGAGLLLTLLLAFLFRRELAASLLHRALAGSSLEARELRVAALNWDGLDLRPLSLALEGQQLEIGRLQVRPPGPGAAGSAELEQVRLNLDLGRLLASLKSASTASPAARASEPAPLPDFSTLSAEGRLGLGVGPSQLPAVFSVKATSDREAGKLRADWTLEAPAFAARGGAGYERSSRDSVVDIQQLDTTLEALRSLAGPLFPEALADWRLSGALGVRGRARLSSGAFAGEAVLVLANGSLAAQDGSFELSGLSGELVLSDVPGLVSAQGQVLRASRLKVGDIELEELELRFRLEGAEHLRVEAFTARVFGGRVSLDPVLLNPAGPDYALSLRMEGIEGEKLMRLFPDARVDARGRVRGFVPLAYGPRGLRLGRGWLALEEQTPAMLRLDHPGLLTTGMAPGSPSYQMLKPIEDGVLNLRVRHFRAEIYGGEEQQGPSAVLRVEGEPLDPKLKAPVFLDINVTGPLGALIRWGADSRLRLDAQ